MTPINALWGRLGRNAKQNANIVDGRLLDRNTTKRLGFGLFNHSRNFTGGAGKNGDVDRIRSVAILD